MKTTNRGVFRAASLAAIAAAVLGVAPACGGATRTGGDGSGGRNGSGEHDGSGGTGAAPSTGGTRGGTFLSPDDFDRSCDSIADCAPIHDGDQCACHQCPTTAINANAIDEWDAARSKIGCPRLDCSPTVCPPRAYTCRDHRCIGIEAPNIQAQDYDRKCQVNKDCAVIPIGLQCAGGCDCTSIGAVSQAGYEEAVARANEFACSSSSDDCACPLPPEAAECVFFSGGDTGECRIASSIVPPEQAGQYAVDYEDRCATDDDCRVVTEGKQCCLHCAEYAAIAASAISNWESALSLLACPETKKPCPGSPKPNACPRVTPRARCVGGLCDVQLLELL